MPARPRILLNFGKYHRIWPFADVRNSTLYVSVALVRPFVKPICKLLQSKDEGETWTELVDFQSMEKRNSTTGQPFVTKEGTILVPVWNVGFYTDGITWLAIYQSDDKGTSWEKAYEDADGTYGKHFFQSPNGNLYLGVGVGGGGSRGRVSYRPGKAYLLQSEDSGKNWKKVLEVDFPTALYSGVAFDTGKKVVVSAREKKSLFYSLNECKSWAEMPINNIARCISFIEELGKIVVSSDSSLFILDDTLCLRRLNIPIKGMMLRYPTWCEGKLYMSSVGWHSYVVSTDLNKWYTNFDVTAETGSNLGARMAILNDCVFVGDEANGTLIRANLSSTFKDPLSPSQILRGNLSYLVSLARIVSEHIVR